MATWLITGASGFLGRHVLDLLETELALAGRHDDTVLALGRRRPMGIGMDRFVAADLEDPEGLRRAILDVAPDHVIHTAGQTPPATDESLYRKNFWATIRLLKAIRLLDRKVRVVLAGSAAELGRVPAACLPVAEDWPCNPADAYGRGKRLATVAGLTEGPPLEVCVARVFNPMGPGMPSTQAFGDFASQLAASGPDPLPLVVGNLNARRDFIDVRDVARAFIAIANRGRSGLVYHVGTGLSRTVAEGLEQMIQLSGRAVRLCVDPCRAGRQGPDDSRAHIGRIIDHTGWTPAISFEQSLHDLWNAHRASLEGSRGEAVARLPLTA